MRPEVALRQPVIKWPGSKRRVAAALHALWPAGRRRYLEPCVGGGSMLPGRPAPRAVAGDVVPELVALWEAVRDRPASVAAHYRTCWTDRQARGAVVYDAVRDRFNRDRAPEDLLFLSRTCVNGLIRFNRAGDFNNSLHHTRPGIHPDRLDAILAAWSTALADVAFHTQDARETVADAGPDDAVFLDPPYRHTVGRYGPDGLSHDALLGILEHLRDRGVPWMLTFDGSAGARSYDGGIPEGLYVRTRPLPTGHSPFPRLAKRGLDRVVETVYLGF